MASCRNSTAARSKTERWALNLMGIVLRNYHWLSRPIREALRSRRSDGINLASTRRLFNPAWIAGKAIIMFAADPMWPCTMTNRTSSIVVKGSVYQTGVKILLGSKPEKGIFDLGGFYDSTSLSTHCWKRETGEVLGMLVAITKSESVWRSWL